MDTLLSLQGFLLDVATDLQDVLSCQILNNSLVKGSGVL